MGAGGRRRLAGVSQVATVLALIIVSVSAAVIISVNTGGGVIAGVRLRNLGPGTISYGDIKDWQVVVDGELRRVWQVLPEPPAQVQPGETVAIGLTRATAPSSGKPHSITVYGPHGVKAQASYQPPGG